MPAFQVARVIIEGGYLRCSSIASSFLVNRLCANALPCITPLVLLPSETLLTFSAKPIIDVLWFTILRQVPGRTARG
jgi:hypothetical protein